MELGPKKKKKVARHKGEKLSQDPPSTELSRSANGQVAVRAPVHSVSELRDEERDKAAGPEPNEAAARRRENGHI